MATNILTQLEVLCKKKLFLKFNLFLLKLIYGQRSVRAVWTNISPWSIILHFQQDKLRSFEVAYLANLIGDFHYNEERFEVWILSWIKFQFSFHNIFEIHLNKKPAYIVWISETFYLQEQLARIKKSEGFSSLSRDELTRRAILEIEWIRH